MDFLYEKEENIVIDFSRKEVKEWFDKHLYDVVKKNCTGASLTLHNTVIPDIKISMSAMNKLTIEINTDVVTLINKKEEN